MFDIAFKKVFVKKVRYLKREVTHGDKLSTKNKDFKDIRRYEYDYLEYVPDVEREREKNTPKLSFNFLKQNVNADQRRIIIGYLIHLGVSIMCVCVCVTYIITNINN